jgi:VRR-NUC domain
MTEQTPAELPPKYYLDYFTFLLAFVQRLYGHILNEQEKHFIRAFAQLSEDAQCLFVRFSNRRGLFFRTNKLKYAEIEDIAAALYELEEGRFIEALSPKHAAQAAEVVGLFTKDEWVQMAPPTDLSLKPLKKPDLIRYLLHHFSFANLCAGIAEPVVKVQYETEVMMMKFLFFGNRHADMTEFVVRDLGKINFERFRDDSYTARFNTRQEADHKLLMSLTSEAFFEQQEAGFPPEDIFEWFMNWQAGVGTLSEVAMPNYGRLINKVGVYLERQKLPEQALMVYQLTNQAPARERSARLLQRLGLTEEARALCELMANEPQNADERFFAVDFTAKLDSGKSRTKKRVTQFLQEADYILLPLAHRYRVEQGVADYFVAQGRQAVHSENYPWRGLFGLVFWDIIYDENVQAIHHPLQRMPSDFYQPGFFAKRETQLKQRLAELNTQQAYVQWIEHIFIEKYGTANVLVEWHEVLLELTRLIAERLQPEQLAEILLEMARNLRQHTRGFADLLVWDNTDFELIEVKSPTDHLSAQQLHWIQFMQQIGVKARVLRVEWQKEVV